MFQGLFPILLLVFGIPAVSAVAAPKAQYSPVLLALMDEDDDEDDDEEGEDAAQKVTRKLISESPLRPLSGDTGTASRPMRQTNKPHAEPRRASRQKRKGGAHLSFHPAHKNKQQKRAPVSSRDHHASHRHH